MANLVTAFALVAVVLTLSALASGIVERAPLSLPIMFLGLGFLMGERGFGLLTLTPEDPTLETIATHMLMLVLFLDACAPGGVLQKRRLSDARLSPKDQCLAAVVQAIEVGIQALLLGSPSD